jgi:hypothetical protein
MSVSINTAVFAEGTRRKFRFPMGAAQGGSISIEDVWDLPLKARANRNEASLNELAQILTDQVEQLPKRNFVDDDEVAAKADPNNYAAKLEIVLAIISVKKAEAKAKTTAAVNASQVAELDAIIARKQQAELENLSVEELQKRREALAAGAAV